MNTVSPPCGQGATILIVDDVPANLRLLVGMLRERGYRPRPLTNGAAALRVARESPPDLILLDVNMPEMGGFEVCQQLKSDPALAGIPVLFISAVHETLDKVKAFTLGGLDYITKPFHCEEVEARIRTHLELRRRGHQLEENYRQLKELEGLRDNLTQMVVHDMRSPMFIVQAVLDLLGTGNTSRGPEADRMLQAARESVTRLNEMATQLLDISRMEAGQMPLRPARQDLVLTSRKACASFAFSALQKHVQVVAPGPVPVTCDHDLVQRVIENLLGNALKFSPDGGEVTLTVSQADSGARVAVSDRGPGIAAKDHGKVFEKYGQVADKRSKYGVGLGLTFCKLAITAHGGAIGLESVPGQGSTFWFTLPRGQTMQLTADAVF